MRSPPGGSAFALRALVALAIAATAALLVLPIAALFVRVPPAALFARLASPVVLDALRLSLVTSLAATALSAALGLPVAYALARGRFRGRRLLGVMVEMPMVLPPTVAGLALLLAFGRAGLAGRALEAFGVTLPFTTLGVVVAQTFMALPFLVAPARAAFASVDPRYLEVAATLRADEARTFLRVVLPLAMPSVLAGAAMCCARALGEFGATITFAGNLPGVTQTMPLAVYIAFQTDLEAAVTLAVVLVAFSLALLLGLRLVAPWALAGGRDAARGPR